MLGLIYLALCFGVGFVICNLVCPGLAGNSQTTYSGRKAGLPSFFVTFPVWLLTGTVPVVWLTYLFGYLFRNAPCPFAENTSRAMPLFYANLIVMPIALLFVALGLCFLIKRRRENLINPFAGLGLGELIFVLLVVSLVFTLMFWTLFVRDGRLYVGVSVFSDFAPHLGMIRSFSYGTNFPTQYSHFGGEDIKYHFLFQFLVGNLEFLGMRIDFAFNLPSCLFLVGAVFLLFAYAVRLTGKRGAGYLATLFFLFRSSRALFDYLSEIDTSVTTLTEALSDNMTFIGTTEHEDWGLWNLNVYCNQRHLAIGICAVLFLLYMLTDCVFLAARRVRKCVLEAGKKALVFEGTESELPAACENAERSVPGTENAGNTEPVLSGSDGEAVPASSEGEESGISENGAEKHGDISENGAEKCCSISENAEEKRETKKTAGTPSVIETGTGAEELIWSEKMLLYLKYSLFTKEGWLPRSVALPVLLGLLLGLCSFFNGACVIACLAVLFLMAFVADHRLEYAIVAGLTVLLAELETHFFIDGSAVSPQYYFGFLAENKTFFGLAAYILALCGILPAMLLAASVIINNTHKWLLFCFTAPFILACTLSLTTDVTVNHKYIMLSVMLLGIYAAMFLYWLFCRSGVWPKAVAAFLVIVMTGTGIYDFTVVLKKNDSSNGGCVTYALDDEITMWFKENATSSDLVLSNYYSLHPAVLGGAMLYYGWPYFAWSAGYDTSGRELKVRAMFAAETPSVLAELITENNIRFIYVDNDLRNSTEFELHEETIMHTYEAVFTSGDVVIYDTRLPVTEESPYYDPDFRYSEWYAEQETENFYEEYGEEADY